MCCSGPGSEYKYRLEEINILLIMIIVIKQCLFLLLIQWGVKDQLK